jgi:CsoR family transcriptional regulator, copper-sensing transcriptional repressor
MSVIATASTPEPSAQAAQAAHAASGAGHAAPATPHRAFADSKTRTDLLNRLKRAEGQLRGIQRMIEEDQPCLDIATQMAAVRKALDSTYVRMTVCFMEERLQPPPASSAAHTQTADQQRQQHPEGHLQSVLGDVQELLGKLR